MPPLESEAYNIVFESPGLTMEEIHNCCRSANTPSQTVAALQTLEELGRIEQRIVDKKRRYYATTQAQVDQAKAEKAAAERKQREKVIEQGEVDRAKQLSRSPSRPTPIKPADKKGGETAKKGEPKRATEADLHAAYAEGFDHGRMHACAVFAGVTDMPGDQARSHYWQISQAGRKERAA